ncbi:MAG: hypothetical protein KME20_10435 [Kaiparowitsia implicata GSE-PSE-MK54-09C]|nr:hypothetical protein [Kaiparowitsia implicata GSE-PSE-MK54-09C]
MRQVGNQGQQLNCPRQLVAPATLRIASCPLPYRCSTAVIHHSMASVRVNGVEGDCAVAPQPCQIAVGLALPLKRPGGGRQSAR